MKKLIYLISLVLLFSCGPTRRTPHPSPTPTPIPVPDPDNITDINKKASVMKERLTVGFLENKGWVVYRQNNQYVNQGNSMYWSGIAMASLNCLESQPIYTAFELSAQVREGAFVRFDPIPEQYQAGDETFLEGEYATMFGLVSRYNACAKENDQEAKKIKNIWSLHKDFVTLNEMELYPTTEDKVTTEINYVWQTVSKYLGVGNIVNYTLGTKEEFEKAILAWATEVNTSHTGCEKVHNATILAMTLDGMNDKVSDATKQQFCQTAQGMDIPLTDFWCFGEDQEKFLKDFKVNAWQYRNSKCSWDKPDGVAGLETPALDFLLVYKKRS